MTATSWVCLGVAYAIGVRVAFGYHLRKENEGSSLTLAQAFDKWEWSSTATLEKALAFPILLPLKVLLFLTRFLTVASFNMTDKLERRRLEEARIRVQVKRELEEINRELDQELSQEKRLSA